MVGRHMFCLLMDKLICEQTFGVHADLMTNLDVSVTAYLILRAQCRSVSKYSHG